MSPKAKRSQRSGRLEAEATKGLADFLSFSLGVEEILRSIAQRAAQLLGVSRAAVFTWDREVGLLRAGPRYLAEPDGRDEEWRRIEIPFPDPRVLERMISARKSMVLRKPKGVPPISGLLKAWGGESVLVIPMVWDGKVVGVLALDEPQKKRAFGPEEVETLFTFAGLAAMGIENARLFQASQQELAERKRMEEVLQASEERFRMLLENANEAIVVVQDNMLKFANPRVLTVTSYSKEEINSRPFAEFSHPDDREMVMKRYRERFKDEMPPTVYPFRIIDKGGNVRWLEVSAVLITWEGRPAVLGLLRDISERKRMEEALRDGKQLLERTLYSLRDAVFIIDADTVEITDCNPAASEIFGYGPEEMLGRTTTFLHVDEAAFEEFRRHLHPAVEEKGFLGDFEFHMKHKDGRIFPTEHSVAPLEDEKGKRIGWVSVVRDITERKRAQEEYETILRTTMDGFWIVDMQGRFLDVNDAYCRLIGYSRDELLKMSISDIEAVEEPEETAQRIRRITETGGDRFETRHRCKDGRIVDIEISVNYMEIGGGRMSVFVRDITQRKRAEDALRQYAKELGALREVGLGLTAQLDLDALLYSIVARAVELVGGTSGGLYLYRAEQDLLEWAVSIGPNLAPIGAVLRRGEGLSGKVWESGEPLIVDDYGHWEGRAVIYDDLPFTAIVGVPVRWGEEFIGVLDVLADAPRTFSPADAELLGLFATQVAIAIKNARLFSTEEQRAKEFEALYGTSLDLASLVDLPALLGAVLRRAADLLDAKAGGLYIYDPLAEQLELVVSYNLSRDYNGTRLALGEGLSGRVAQSGRPLSVDDYNHWEGRSSKYADEDLGAVLGVPLKRGETLLGVLFLDRKGFGRFDERDVRLASLFASQAAIAIENARLYEQTDEKLQERVAELATINAIVEAVIRSLDLNEVLSLVVEKTAQVMKARICTIRLVEGNELNVAAAVGYKDKPPRQHRARIDRRLARIVKDGQVLMVEDLWEGEDVPKTRRERAKKEGVRSFLGVPMIARKGIIGILSVYREEAGLFSEREKGLLITIANQAAMAVENAQLHENVQRHADELEQRVEERTRELQAMQLELIQTAKLAALGQLAAGVAHELNNPLGAISGYVELLREEGKIEGPASDYLERVQGRIEQATKIVRELKGFGTPKEPTRQLVEIGRVLEDTLGLVKRELSFHRIRVQKRVGTRLSPVLADPHQLEQVFLNLIVNARQAMKEGGRLRLIARQAAGGEWVELIVGDRGEGIRPEHLAKIFDPFFTTRAPGEGTGLGLSVSYRIIRDHEGAIDVWSKRGVGSIFRVALPTKKARRCWEIIGCGAEKQCKAGAEKAGYRCWTVVSSGFCEQRGHGRKGCKYCPVFPKKILPSLDKRLLPPQS